MENARFRLSTAQLNLEFEAAQNRLRLKSFALGGIAWEAALSLAARHACALSQPKPKFAHGAVVQLCEGLHLVGSYHVSQQNTFTGRLTNAMFDTVLERCKQLSR